ncbi:MAG: hypothetical protein ACRDFW_05880 [bacterium]
MKNDSEEKLFSMGELLLIAVVFSVFAITLLSLTSLDPDLVLWGGSMGLGSLYVPEPPPRLFDDPREALQMASKLCLVGLVALLCLMGFIGTVKSGWLPWLKARWAESRPQSARGGGELAETRAEGHSQAVERDLER